MPPAIHPIFITTSKKKKKKEFDQTHISLQMDDGTVKFRLFSEEAIKWPC
jgi:hypothetical protein